MMSDSLRLTSSSSPAPNKDAERNAKIESLLLQGLDHYFASDYAQAIDVWTRALFLDRNHARARAYIERARGALAEQQRESEEMLHSGIAAFERGQFEPARQLLNAAVQRGGAHDVALAFLTRIERISAAMPSATEGPNAPKGKLLPAAQPERHISFRLVAGAIAVAVLGVAGYGLISGEPLTSLIPGLTDADEGGIVTTAPPREPLIVPRGADMAMERAQSLFAGGHLHDALRALDLVRPTDPQKPDADKLKATIQRELLAHARSTP